MTGFDFIVLVIVGVAAIGGFMRGLVQEVLSLAAWILAAFAIYYLHSPLTDALGNLYDADPATSILAFALLLLIPYAAMKVIAANVGEASRNSILGPIDRVLGFGFGAVKGALIVIFAFSVLVLGLFESPMAVDHSSSEVSSGGRLKTGLPSARGCEPALSR